jgi:hypothetical protein
VIKNSFTKHWVYHVPGIVLEVEVYPNPVDKLLPSV